MAAAKRAFAVRQLKGEGLSLASRGDREAGDIGPPAVRCAVNEERAVDLAEAQRGAPEALEIGRRGRLGARVRGEGDGERRGHG